MPAWRHTGGGRMGRAFAQLRSARCARAKSAVPEVAVSYGPRRAPGVERSAALTARRGSDRDRSAEPPVHVSDTRSACRAARCLPGAVRRRRAVATGGSWCVSGVGL